MADEHSYEARTPDGALVARARTRDRVDVDARHNGHRVGTYRITQVPRRRYGRDEPPTR